MASILFHMFLGTLKQEKVYKGIDCRAEWINVVLLAYESSLASHPWSLELSFSTRKWKLATLLPLSLKFNPKYLLGFRSRLTFKIEVRFSWSTLGVFGEQKRSDLAKLMFLPEIEQYQWSTPWILSRDLIFFLKKMSESFANNKCVKVQILNTIKTLKDFTKKEDFVSK